jgi:hypothetical protein
VTATARTLLEAFDALPPDEKQQVAAAILRRTAAAGGLMKRGKSRRWWLLGVVAVAAVVGYRCLPLTPLPAPSGDGEFTDLSWRARACFVPVIDVRGFAVSMPRFELGKDHTADYRVAHLPDIGQECGLYLAINDPQGRWVMRDDEIRKLRGSLTLEVLDGDGRVIRRAEGALSAYVWGYWRGADRLHQMDALFFRTRSEGYTLRVAYKADPALAGYWGYCDLECGERL